MHIDHLQIELRPRTNAQALDLGYALLRSHAAAAYLSYLALWLPVAGLALALTAWDHSLTWLWLLMAWWLKPLLERAPLYVLSRQVFGTAVTWQEAVRAWPRQLGGGWFRLLTWGRPLAAGRALIQPVWQLEMARGAVASARMRVLGRSGTGASAFWFGMVCFWLEGVLFLGMAGLISIFVSDASVTNPFAIFIGAAEREDALIELVIVALAAVTTAIMAPIYTACGFCLYLNRRASLEAWDIELQLRRIRPPAVRRARAGGALAVALALGALLVLPLGAPAPALAAAPAAPAAPSPVQAPCAPLKKSQPTRGALQAPQQAQVRQMVDRVYAHEDLRGYECAETWHWKHAAKFKQKEKEKDKKERPLNLGALAQAMKVLFIAALIGVVAWLLYRYRDIFPAFRSRYTPAPATEVAGLDIRAESLPDDITATVRAHWARGERRAALGLLYRATLSRMVAHNGLQLRQGNTEGDCLRLAAQACRDGLLGQGRLQVAEAATALWLAGAYGERWPDTDTVEARCRVWDEQFGAQAPSERAA